MGDPNNPMLVALKVNGKLRKNLKKQLQQQLEPGKKHPTYKMQSLRMGDTA